MQSIFGVCNTVRKVVDGIVQTSDIAARIIAQRYRVAQLCPKNGLMLILKAVEPNIQFKATVGAQQHHVGIRHLLPSQQKPFARSLFVIVHHALDSHAAEVFFVLWVCCCNL